MFHSLKRRRLIKVVAWALLLFLYLQIAVGDLALAQMIVVDGLTSTVLETEPGSNVTHVRTSTLIGGGSGAVNSFQRFNVDAGHTVNLHLPTGTHHLINLVHQEASEIKGVLNSIKGDSIGGNVYFLNPHGVFVTQSGVVNVGSLNLLTPTQDFMASFDDGHGDISMSAVNAVLQGTVPISPTGLVRVDGRIYSIGDVKIEAGKIAVDGTIGTGAVFGGSAADFTDVVNLSGLDSGVYIATENGQIRLVADSEVTIDKGRLYTDGAPGVDAGNIEIEASRLIEVGSNALLSAEGHGEDSKDGAIKLTATSQDTRDGAAESAASAEIRVEGGQIRGGSISLTAKASSEYAWLGISFLIAPGGFLAPGLTGQDVVVAKSSAKSSVNVAGGSRLIASGPIKLEAASDTKINTKTFDIGQGVNLGFAYGELNSQANVHVASGATVSGSQVSASAVNKASMDMSITSTTLQGQAIESAVLVGSANVQSAVRFARGAQISSDGAVTLKAENTNEFATSVSAVARQLATEPKPGNAGIAVAIFSADTSAEAVLETDLVGVGSLSVTANDLTQKNRTKADTGTGDTTPIGKAASAGQSAVNWVQEQINQVYGKTETAPRSNATKESLPALAATVTIVDSSQRATATIADGVRVEADGPVGVSATVLDNNSRVRAKAGNSSQHANLSISAAVAYGSFQREADASIGDDAVVSTSALGVSSEVKVPYEFTWHKWEGFSSLIDKANMHFGMENQLSGYANSTGSAENVGIAGSVLLITHDNRSEARIGRGAQVQVHSAVSPPGEPPVTNPGTVDVKALNHFYGIYGAGNFNILLQGTSGGEEKPFSLGGSYSHTNVWSQTRAFLAEGATIKHTAEDPAPNVSVNAISEERVVGIGPTAGRDTGIGVNGVFVYNNIDNVTHAWIDDEARVDAGTLQVQATDDVISWAVTGAINASESAGVGLSIAINDVTTSTRAFIGDNDDYLQGGSQKALEGKIAARQLKVNARTDGLIEALTVALAGAFNSSPSPPSSGDEEKAWYSKVGDFVKDIPGQAVRWIIRKVATVPENVADSSAAIEEAGGGALPTELKPSEGETPSAEGPEPKFGIGISGSSSVNEVDLETLATIDSAVIEITGGGSESVTVGAVNAMDIGAVSGGAALTRANNENSKFSAGVAGTLAINLIDTKTIAEVKNSTVTGARNVDIYSLMGGEQFSVAAGLSANISSDQSKAGTVAGSVSVSIVANETKAAITDSTVEGKEGGSPGDVDVVAYDRSRLGTGGGALMAGGRVALGAAFTYAEIANTTEASISRSTLSDFANIRSQALNASLIGSAAAMGGVQWEEDGVGLAGSFVVNKINNATRSVVAASTVTRIGNVAVLAHDTAGDAGLDAIIDSHDCEGAACPKIASFLDLTGAGLRQDGSIDQGIAAAAADAGSNASNTVSDANKVLTDSGGNSAGSPEAGPGDHFEPGDGLLQGSSIVTVAGNLQGGRGNLGLSFAWNEIGNEFSASIVDSIIEASGDTDVRATSNATIISVAVGAAMADKFAGGASVAINQIHNTTSATVKATTERLIDTGALRVEARDSSELNSGAGNVGMNFSKDGPGSAGVTVAFSGINNTTRASIDGYNVDASGDVQVKAVDDSVIRSFGAGVSISTGGTTLAGSAAFSEIGNVTEAQIVSAGNRSVKAGSLAVTARDDSMIIAVAGELAATGGSTSVGGAAAVNWVTNQTRALVENVNVAATGAVAIAADSTTTIGTGSASAGGGESVAVSGSATVSVIVNSTEALLRSDHGNTLTAASLSLSARDAAAIFAAAGQFGYGGKAAVGGAVVHGQVLNTTRAALNDVMTTVSGDASVNARNTSWIFSVGASGGGSQTAVVNGSITSSFIGNETVAEVTSDSGATVSAQALSVSAQDDAIVGTLSGQLGISSGSAAVGGAATVSYVGNTTRARVDGAHILLTEDLSLNAKSNTWIVAGALAGQGAAQAAVGASLTTSIIDNATEAEITGNSASVTAGNVQLHAQDDSKIFTVAGQLAGSGNTAVGAGVAVAVITNTTRSRIVDAEVDADQTVAVQAVSKSIVASIGVSGQGSSTAAVGASNTTNTITNTTVAEVSSSGGSAIKAGALRVQAWDQAQLYTLAGQLAGSGNTAVGGAIAVGIVNNETRASVSNVDVDVASYTTLEAIQTALLMVGAAAGVGSGQASVAAGMSTSIVTNKTIAELLSQGRTVESDSINLKARDSGTIYSLAGKAAGAGAAAGGGAGAHNQILNTTRATASGGAIRVGVAFNIEAESESIIRTLAASGSIAGNAAIDGSLASSHVNNVTVAELLGAVVTGATGRVAVEATDKSSIESISGAPAAAGSGAGFGVAMSVNQVGNTTRARVSGGSLNVGNLLVRGHSHGLIRSIAASIGLAAVGAGVAGSTAINLINNDTLAGIDGAAKVLAQGNVGVVAWSDDQVTNAAGVLGGAGKGAGVGLSATVNEIGGRTAASISGSGTVVTALAAGGFDPVRIADGRLTSQTDLEGALKVTEVEHFDPTIDFPSYRRTTDVRGVAVNASSTHHVQNYVANTSGGFWGGVSGLANVNVITGTTEAFIQDAAINRAADGQGGPAQSVHVGASDHALVHDYVLSAGAGMAGVGASLNATAFDRDTLARIEGSSELRAMDRLTVDARSSQGLASVVAGAGAGGVGGAGSANLAIITGQTEARLQNSTVYSGDVSVGAHALGRLFTSAGSAAGAVNAVAGAFAIIVDQGVSRASIDGSTVRAAGQVTVDAESDTEFQTWAASGSGGASSGVAGSAVVSIVQRTTEAYTNATNFGTQGEGVGGLSVHAADRVTVKNRAGAIGVGPVGAGGVAAVTTVGNTTSAYMAGGQAFVQGDATVQAESERYLSTLAASGGLGGLTLAVNVAVILAGAHLAGDALEQLDSKDNNTLNRLTAFGTSDRVIARGDQQTIQLILDHEPEGGADAPVTLADLDRVNRAGQIDVSKALREGTLGATTAQVRGNAVLVARGNVTIEAKTRDRASIIAGGADLGVSGAFGASVGVLDMANTVDAAVLAGANVVSSDGGIRITAGAGRLDRYDGDDLLCDSASAASVCAFQGDGGSIALGAAVAVGNLSHSVSARVARGGQLRSQGVAGVTVDAFDEAGLSATAHGYQLGYLTGGAAVATATRRGSTHALVGNDASNGAQTELRATEGSVSVLSRRQGGVNALAIAGSGGVQAAAIGSGATAEDGGEVKAVVGNQVLIEALQGAARVNASATPAANATARGYGGSILGGAVGASVAVSRATPQVEAAIGSGGTVRSASMDVRGIVSVGNAPSAESFAQAAGVGLLAGAEAAVGEAHSTAQVTVSVGSKLEISGDAWIGASNVTRQQATVSGIVGGVAAAGASVAEATANGTTRAIMTSQASGSVGGRLTVNASGADETYSEATSGSGGVAAGAAAAATTRNYSNTVAQLGTASAGIKAGAIDVAASHTADFDGKVNTIHASVVGMSGAISVHDVNSRVQAAIANAARLETYDLAVLARNVSRKNRYSNSAFQVEAGSGGIFDGAAASGTSTVRHETDVLLGKDAHVDVVGSWEDPGRTDFTAINEVLANEAVRLDSGGAISVALATSKLRADLIGRTVMDNGARLQTVGDLNMGVRTNATLYASANAKTYGLSGAASGRSDSEVVVTEHVRVGQGAWIQTDGDANFYAGRDFSGRTNEIGAIARTDLFNKTVAPIKTSPDANALVSRTGLIDIEGGASVRTVGDIYLLTDNGSASAYGQGIGTDLYRSLLEELAKAFRDDDTALHLRAGKSTREVQTGVTVHGALEAGINNKLFLVIGTDGNVETQSHGIRFTVTEENLAVNLIERLRELYALRAAYASDLESRGAFDSEINFVIQQLRDMGYPMTDPDDGVQFIADSFAVEYINVSDAQARGGNISVTGGYLAGSGTLRAASDAQINIENKSSRFLRLGKLLIDDSGGRLILNGNQVNSLDEIRNFNGPGSPAADFALDVAGASTSKPSINVENTYIPSGSTTSPVPDIEVTGDIVNRTGTVNISNARGNIKIQGVAGNAPSITANEINLRAYDGSIMQSYVPGFVHIGGDPKSIWSDAVGIMELLSKVHSGDGTTSIDAYIETFQRACAVGDSESCDLLDQFLEIRDGLRPGSGSMIAGNNILLSARYLNINGTIQSGIPDRIMRVDTSSVEEEVHRRIAAIKAHWEAAGRPAIADVRAIPDYLISDGIGQNVAVFYNPQTNQIVVDAIEVKGGYVELYGQILNTGGGRIRALDGYGRIDLWFDLVGYDVVVHTLDTGGVEGIIRITDLAKVDEDLGGPVTTVYERLGDRVRIQEWVGDTLLSEDEGGTPGRTAVYQPARGQRFAWNRGQDFTITYVGTRSDSTWFWLFPGGESQYNDWSIVSDGNEPKDLPEGDYVTEGSQHQYDYGFRRYMTEYQRVLNENWSVCEGVNFLGVCVGGVTYYVRDTYKQGRQDLHFHSVRADHPIAIEFIGYDEASDQGGLTAWTRGRLILNGDVRHTGGEVFLNGHRGIVQAAEEALVTGRSLRLISQNENVGGASPINVRQLGGGLFVTATQGDINLRDFSDELLISRAWGKGVVTIDADGGIVYAAEPIEAERLVLTSRRGQIGNGAGRPLPIKVGTGPQGGLIATAQGDIAVRQAEGDLHLITVESRVGDVWIEVAAGDLVDANRNETRDERTIEQLEALWSDMLLLEGEGAEESAQATLDAYRAARESEYHLYWRLRGVRPVFDEHGNILGYDSNPYDPSQAGEWMDAERYAQLHEAFGSQPFDPGFTYTLSAAEEAELTEGYAWTRNQLQYALPESILFKRTTSTETRDEEPNIIGRNVTLLTPRGNVGTDRGQIVITDPEQLKDEAVRLALAAAESDDVAVDEETGHVTILLRDSIDVHARESIWVEASDRVYIGSREPIYVKLLTSHGGKSIRVKGKDGLYDISSESAAIYAGDVILEGGDGGIGEEGRPFRLGLRQGSTLTARAAEDIHIRAVNGAINISQIYSLGDVYLDANGAILSTGESPITIQANNIHLLARGGSVGTSELPLALQPAPSGGVSANSAAGHGIFIHGIGGTINFGSLSAGDQIVLTADGSLHLEGQVSGSSVRLIAGGSITQAVGGSISTPQLWTTSGAGQSLIGNNNVQLFFATNNSGDLEFNSSGSSQLLVQGIEQAGGSVSIVSGGTLEIGGLINLATGGTRGNLALSAVGTLDINQVQIVGADELRVSTYGGFTFSGLLDANSISAVNAGGGRIAITIVSGGPVIGDVEQLNGGDIEITHDGSISIAGTLRTDDVLIITATGTIASTPSGQIIAGQLVTQSAGGVDLAGNNQIARLTITNSGGDVVVNNNRNLEIAGISQLDGGDVLVTTDGALVITGAVATTDAVSLTATGSIAEEGSGQIVAASLLTESVGGLNLGGNNEIGRLTATNDGGSVVVNNTGGLELAGISQLTGGDVVVTNAGALVISGTIETADAVSLTADGSIDETGAGRIAAASLVVESVGGLRLGGANEIGILTATNDGGAVVVNNIGELELAGIRQLDGGDVVVTNDGALVISGVIDTVDAVGLTATGSIAQADAGRIAASSLEAQSVGGLSLGGANEIGILMATNDGGAVVVNNIGELELAGISQLNGGDVLVTTDGALVITGAIATSDAVSLTATGSIAAEGSGRIATASLVAQSVGGLSLSGVNEIGRLTAANDGGAVVVNNTGGLELAGISQLDGGDVLVTNDGALVISGAIETSDAVDLAATGSITQVDAGQIAASSLVAQGVGGLSLGGANVIGILTVTNDGGAVVFNHIGDLELVGISQLNGGDVLVTTDGALVITGAVATTDAVSLTATGSIAEAGSGRIVAASLLTDSVGGLNLGGNNEIGRLTATNDGGSVVVNNTGGLELAGISQLDGGDVVVTNDGAIVISGTIETVDEVELAATGSIAEEGSGRIIAASLLTESVGGLNLGGANEISRLTATNDGGAVVVNNIGDLELAGISQLDGGDVLVTTDGALVISGAIETSDAVDMTATGSIAQVDAGRIAASNLVAQSVGGLHLGGANEIGILTATNDGGAVVVNNIGDSELAGISQLDGGDVVVTNDGVLFISGAVSTSDAVGLTATGRIAQVDAGRIAASSLVAQSVGGLSLGGANVVGILMATNDGGAVVVNNIGDLELAGIIQLDGGDVVVTNDGAIVISGAIETVDAVELAATGSIAEEGVGRIAAASLLTESVGGLNLGGGNEISRLTATNDGGAVFVNNIVDLELAGIIQLDGGNVLVTNDGAIVISGAIKTSDAVSLTADGSIAQVDAGRIAASSLVAQSVGGLHLGGANEFGVLTATNDGGAVVVNHIGDLELVGVSQLDGGDVLVTNDGAIVINGAVWTSDAVGLIASGSIAEVGTGRIAAASLQTESVGGLNLGGDNEIGRLTATNDGGAVVVNNIGDLDLAGINQLADGDVLVTNHGVIVISGAIDTSDSVDLAATGSITQVEAGRIAASSLVAQSVGGLHLGGANEISRLTTTNDGGAVVFNNIGDLELVGISQLAGGDIVVTTDGSLVIRGVVETSDAVSLSASGFIAEVGTGRIAAVSLLTESVGGLNLGGDNRVSRLMATNDGGVVAVYNIGDLELAGISQLSGGDVLVTNDGAIVISSIVETVDTVDLAATKSIAEVGAGRIVAGNLVTQSTDGLDLGGANEIGILTATNDGGVVVVNNIGDLELAGVRQLAGGDVLVTNDGSLVISGAIDTSDSVELAATGSITQVDKGRIAASSLVAQSVGGLHLGGANEVGILTATNDDGAVIVNHVGDLELVGISQLNGGDVLVTNDGAIVIRGAIETSDAVGLTANGSIEEVGAGRIAATSLVTQSEGGTSLLGENTVARFAAHDLGEAGIELNNVAQHLVIDEVEAGSGDVSIRQSGVLAFAGSLRTAGDILLSASGSILNVDPTGLAEVVGRNLQLLSINGGIGEADRRLGIRATGTVNVTADADIYLRAEGDFNSDLVETRRGSVDLITEGGSIDIDLLRLSVSDEASALGIRPLASLPTFARIQGRVIRIEDLVFGGTNPLELAFRGEDGLAEYIDVNLNTSSSVVVTHLEADEARLTSSAHDLDMRHVMIGSLGEFLQGDTSVVVQVPPGEIVDADVMLYSDQPFFLTFHPDGTVSTDAVMLYTKPGSPAVPGGTQNSVVGITQILDSVMRQEMQRISGVHGIGGQPGQEQDGSVIIDQGGLSVYQSEVDLGVAISIGGGDETTQADEDKTSQDNEDEAAQEQGDEEERSDE